MIMRILIPFAKKWAQSPIWLAGTALLLLAVPLTAAGELGGDAASVLADQVHMKASLKTTRTGGYTVHEIEASSGTVVREYISSEGKVFAVAWRGPFLPDLHQILGTSFEPFARAARAQKTRRPGHGPVSIQQERLVVTSAGHARNFFGRAYLPGLLPQGMNAEDIR
jgi:Protein of unknown function (DUF2844)